MCQCCNFLLSVKLPPERRGPWYKRRVRPDIKESLMLMFAPSFRDESE